MKIKAVCEATGLSDRTIRYYIEEGLILPKYTENYLGRKTFDFSEQNIEELKHISVLRSFDFSIEEISSIIEDSTTSQSIIDAVKQRTEEAVSDSEKKLAVLMQLDGGKVYTVAELANALLRVMSNIPPRNEIIKSDMKAFFDSLKRVVIFLIVWSPIVISIFNIIMVCRDYSYPQVSLLVTIVLCFSLMPSALILFGAGSRFWKKKSIKILLLCLCLVFLPIAGLSSLFTISHSETTNIYSYRNFDRRCRVNRDLMFQELFPVDTPAPLLTDKHGYYYRYSDFLDETYDIYAEWNLKRERFNAEVDRVSKWFEDNKPLESEGETEGYFHQEQRGDFVCLILYKPYYKLSESETDGKYYVFAYDSANMIVRYIHCFSFGKWDEQPYFSDLEW